MKKYYLLLAVFMLFSCSAIDEKSDMSNTVTNTSKAYTRVISPQEAVSNLLSLMDGIYGGTKSSTFDIGELQVFGGIQTKSGNITLPDTTVYVLNFPDSSGYAVMAAQRCMSTPIFCITESGSLSVSDLHEAIALLEQESSIATRAEADSDSAFIIDSGESFVPMLIAASAANQIAKDSITGSIDLPFEKIEYVTVNKIGPLLKTKWHQRSPFNDFRSDGAAAGCVAIAAAQILAHNEYGSLRGRTFDWDLLKTVCPSSDYSNSGTDEAEKAASDFLQAVGSRSNCYIRYDNGSNGYADGVKRTFNNFGYKNVNKYLGFETPDKNRVISMLNGKLPVYTDGSKTPKHGHAWVIDGIYIRDVVGASSGKVLRRENMFHINWGWNGASDGYFSMGVFDTTKRITIDEEVDTNTDTNDDYFTWNYRTVTYSLY